ncbi:MAG: response regulator [Burkholderiales bacterium]|nr:response regulator [Burkholderiales bacterium]
MIVEDAVYQRTESGDTALHGGDTAIPGDYRRILAHLEGGAHVDVIRGALREYSDALIDDWLSELLDLGFIEPVDADNTRALTLEALVNDGIAFRILGELAEDQRRAADLAKEVTESLQRKRAYLSTRRLRNRDRLPKTAGECTVLVVEDDPDQAALADLRVSMAGYSVRLARSRREMFTDLITRPPPDAVLLDVMLPDGDGFQILAGMRRHPKFALIPVIMLTAKTEPDDIQRGLSLGAEAYITKPYSKDVLADTLRQVLRHA